MDDCWGISFNQLLPLRAISRPVRERDRGKRKVNGRQTDVRVRHLLRVPGLGLHEPLASQPRHAPS
jgi:hypothetical protein